MNCHDAREGSSRSEISLTERALVHAHVIQCAECRKERESLVPAPAPRPTRFRVLLSLSLTASGQAATKAGGSARAGAAWVVGLPTRLGRLVLVLAKRSGRVAAGVIAAARLGITHLAHLGTGLGRSLMLASRRATRVASEGARVAATHVLDQVSRVRGLVPAFAKRSEQGARAIGAGRVGIARLAHQLARLGTSLSLAFTVTVRAAAVSAIRVTRGSARVLVRTAGGALSQLGARMTPTLGARPLLKLSTGIAGLAVLVAAVLVMWPRQWSDDLMARFSAGERLMRDVRRPADWNPVDLVPRVPVIEASAPEPASAPPPAPVEVSPPETPRVAPRRRPAETRTAEIPAPLRRPASVPVPAETAQNAEVSDSTAAIDWLLKGGSGRRRIENP